MTIFRNEIRTGILVIVTLVALVCLLLYLGAPGVFVSQKKFRIYLDNASSLTPGAPVLLAGRRIGRVVELYSPVPEKERPSPGMETLVEIEVNSSAKIYNKVKARMTLPSLLGKPVIDFTTGEESSGLAPENTAFVGERQPGLADAVPTLLEKLDPALKKATDTFDGLQKTADNLNQLTKENSDLPKALAEFKKFTTHLNEVIGPDGALRGSLENIRRLTADDGKLGLALEQFKNLTGPDSDLAKTLAHAEKFTGKLEQNEDIDATLHNLRIATANLDRQFKQVTGKLSDTAENLKEGSDTLKHQPWRLIWPSTKKYPDENIVPRAPGSSSKSSGSSSSAGHHDSDSGSKLKHPLFRFYSTPH
ncbi:MlaD family protein [Prosthecobacter sp.]|uniref:MlaD family protein n=1 Tax=Prosthecobacter sp. TaxID=1965333 RepID=UPI003782E25A